MTKANYIVVRGKLYGDDGLTILQVADAIRNALAPHCTTSDLRKSDQGGYHLFLTVYVFPKKEASA